MHRISLGSGLLGRGLANHFIGTMMAGAQQMLQAGDFSWLSNAASGKEINALLRR